MNLNRILIFYISVNSGHQIAAMAIEDAIRILDRSVETLNINHFRYTNPVLAQLIMKTYHGILKRTPEIWDYLYDNPNVKDKTGKLRNLVHKLNTIKLRRLIEWYKPELIVCTQAFPCVAMAEYKRSRKVDIPIVGIVTDYGVHSYWVDADVDLYVVPTEESKERLVELGVSGSRVEVLGIPVNPRFYVPLDQDKVRCRLGIDGAKPVVLIIGGGQGMISMEEIVRYLAKLPLEFYLIVVCGTNKSLRKKLEEVQERLRLPMQIYGYVTNIEEFMSIADIMITKPGGLTITEALVKRLPMVIVNPIPGQEAKNTEFLIRHKAAIMAKDARDVARHVGDLISSPSELERLKQRMSSLSKPKAAFDIAQRIIYWKT